MSEGLKKLGDAFRTKREEMNLSLKEVENATSIRMVYLQAIEEGRVDHFLSNVYALGFIRQYATFLGYENEALNKDFPEAFSTPKRKTGICLWNWDNGNPRPPKRWSSLDSKLALGLSFRPDRNLRLVFCKICWCFLGIIISVGEYGAAR